MLGVARRAVSEVFSVYSGSTTGGKQGGSGDQRIGCVLASIDDTKGVMGLWPVLFW